MLFTYSSLDRIRKFVKIKKNKQNILLFFSPFESESMRKKFDGNRFALTFRTFSSHERSDVFATQLMLAIM